MSLEQRSGGRSRRALGGLRQVAVYPLRDEAFLAAPAPDLGGRSIADVFTEGVDLAVRLIYLPRTAAR